MFPVQTLPCGCGAASLRVSDARLVKYNASAAQTELGLHRDGPLVTATISLSRLDEYGGGGTLIEALAAGERPRAAGERPSERPSASSRTNVKRVPRGHAILHPGAVRHGGEPITRGLRYVLVFFICDADECDHDRYCVLRANVRAFRRDVLLATTPLNALLMSGRDSNARIESARTAPAPRRSRPEVGWSPRSGLTTPSSLRMPHEPWALVRCRDSHPEPLYAHAPHRVCWPRR